MTMKGWRISHHSRRTILSGLLSLLVGFIGGHSTPAEAQVQGLNPGTKVPENALVIHYHRSDGDYTNVGLWTWDGRDQKTPANQEIQPAGRDSFGVIFVVDLDQYGHDNGPAERIGIIPRLRRSWDHKDGGDRYWTPNLGKRIWIVSLDERIYTEGPDVSPRFKHAFLDATNLIVAAPSHPIDPAKVAPAHFRVVDEASGKEVAVEQVRAMTHNAAGKATQVAVVLREPQDWAKARLTVSAEGYHGATAMPRKVLDELPVPGESLGAVWSEDKTTFRVWAPLAESLSIVLYDDVEATKGRKVMSATRRPNGVWVLPHEGNLEGRFYRVLVKNPNREEIEINDPYATNTTGPRGAARITNLRALDPPGFRPVQRLPYGNSPVDAVIVEVHVRDMTISPDSGVSEKNRGKYLGFTETKSHLPGKPDVKTAVAHLKEMGFTHVHLLPIQDFDNSTEGPNDPYNWGYMTAFFNSPDGWFASQPSNESRIREFKELVNALKAEGIGVILDVVYNHVGTQNTKEQLVPGYYLRRRSDGSFYNGSGCGNEFRSEATMGRKFIMESCQFWLEEYGVDGFRFDLMGLIDIDTMTKLKTELEVKYPGILIYGEPWAATGPDGTGVEKITTKDVVRGTGIGAFNDHFRNALKGSPDGDDPGYVVNGERRDGVKRGIGGSIDDWTASPVETINYADKHDNLILYDKLKKTSPKGTTDEDIAKMTMLSGGILAVSQGIPFYHHGVELLRTKGGNNNSYNAPDSVNQVVWSQKVRWANVVDYYRGVITLRRAHPVFRLKTAAQIRERLSFVPDVMLPAPEAIAFTLLGKGLEGESWDQAHILINPTGKDLEFPAPKPGNWQVYVQGDKASSEPLMSLPAGKVKVAARSMTVIGKE
jgi:pullulanase